MANRYVKADANALEFIEDVAKNWEAIMEAKNRNGNPTY